MKNQYFRCNWILVLTLLSVTCVSAYSAQHRRRPYRSWATNVIVPQVRAYSMEARNPVNITGIRAGAVILEQVAVTTLEISLRNPSHIRQESELLVPVPDGAVVSSFAFEGNSSEPAVELLPKEAAAATYNNLVAKIRDPALLEFAGYSLLRSSVFPIEAGGTQKVRLTYENLLSADGNRIDYILPRSESVSCAVPWEISVRIESKTPIHTVYSPTHRIRTVKRSENTISASVSREYGLEPGPFRISYLLRQDEVTASFLAYPDPGIGGGYFLLLAGLPDEAGHGKKTAVKREVTLVIDRSGSMRATKMDHVKKAARDILDGLEPGEAFNLISYNESVESFAPHPTILTQDTRARARYWIDHLHPNGGTNIYDALVEALRPAPLEGLLSQVLFLTDGLPTVGRTSESTIRNMVDSSGNICRRIFTFGVGSDVNTPLLSWIAEHTGGAATFVLDNTDLEAKISRTARRLAGPVMTEPQLKVLDKNGREAYGAIHDMLPQLHDLFQGDQIVVLGVYQENRPVVFELTGNLYGHKRAFRFPFNPGYASVRNSYVPRLWASRKIGFLSDAIRQTQLPVTDPRVKELVDEVVRLSTEFGVMTEYTSFLALEGTDLSRRNAVLQEATSNFVNRALKVRSGKASVNQELNNGLMKGQLTLNHTNRLTDQDLEEVSTVSVRQVADRTFYRKNSQWVDSDLVSQSMNTKPDREIHFGTKEYFGLAERLASDGRQGVLALGGDILIIVDGRLILITGPAAN